ncbi:hypothetical protein C8Q80DRAFT_775120 [Daedaleopsis nitida]|nr:hypothetical protein C8Q80DRAFT_775120 [Daedaleopsis nitida]
MRARRAVYDSEKAEDRTYRTHCTARVSVRWTAGSGARRGCGRVPDACNQVFSGECKTFVPQSSMDCGRHGGAAHGYKTRCVLVDDRHNGWSDFPDYYFPTRRSGCIFAEDESQYRRHATELVGPRLGRPRMTAPSTGILEFPRPRNTGHGCWREAIFVREPIDKVSMQHRCISQILGRCVIDMMPRRSSWLGFRLRRAGCNGEESSQTRQ